MLLFSSHDERVLQCPSPTLIWKGLEILLASPSKYGYGYIFIGHKHNTQHHRLMNIRNGAYFSIKCVAMRLGFKLDIRVVEWG